MMASGDLLAGEETNGGLKTGIAFFNKAIEEGLVEKSRWVLYTITDSSEAAELSEKFDVRHYKKQNYPGKAIVQVVREVLDA